MNNIENDNTTNVDTDNRIKQQKRKRVKQTKEELKAKKKIRDSKYYFAVTKIKRKLKRLEKLNKMNEE